MIPTILNLAGLLSGMIGTVLVFLYGVPNVTEADRVSQTRWDVEPSPKGERKYLRHKRLATLGLALLFLAFACQFIAILLPLLQSGDAPK